MSLVFLIVVISAFTGRSQAISQFVCPDDWLQYNGSCYMFGHYAVHFTEAEHFCRQHHNSHLIRVDDKTENAYIKDKLRKLKTNNWWMGLTDETIEGVFKWFDTDEVTTITDWGPGQPDNYRNEDCVIFYDGNDFTWADVPCTWTCIPICELSGKPCTTGETEIIG